MQTVANKYLQMQTNKQKNRNGKGETTRQSVTCSGENRTEEKRLGLNWNGLPFSAWPHIDRVIQPTISPLGPSMPIAPWAIQRGIEFVCVLERKDKAVEKEI